MSLITNWIESLSYELEISAACTRKISPRSSCTVCIEECPVDSISLKDGEISINDEICTDCGVCVTVCPVQAIKGQSPVRKIVQNYLLLQDDSTLPTMTELLYYHKKGIRFIHKPLINADIKKRIDNVNEALAILQAEPLSLVDQIELSPEEQPRLTRRNFFAKLTMDSKKAVLSSVTPIKWRFNESNFKTSNLYNDWSFYEVRINRENCTLCEACFTVCPEDVFTLEEETLKLKDHKCIGCSLCSDICKENAIQINQHIHRSEDTSFPVHQTICTKCKSSFHSWIASEECPICSNIEKPNFFL